LTPLQPQEKVGAAFHNETLEAHGHAKQEIGKNEVAIGEAKKVAEEVVKDLKKGDLWL
jgi:uncharacterized protein YjbJ (UPF0337 family)